MLAMASLFRLDDQASVPRSSVQTPDEPQTDGTYS